MLSSLYLVVFSKKFNAENNNKKCKFIFTKELTKLQIFTIIKIYGNNIKLSLMKTVNNFSSNVICYKNLMRN